MGVEGMEGVMMEGMYQKEGDHFIVNNSSNENYMTPAQHMQRETSSVQTHFYGKQFAINGHLFHLPAGQKKKFRWFVPVFRQYH